MPTRRGFIGRALGLLAASAAGWDSGANHEALGQPEKTITSAAIRRAWENRRRSEAPQFGQLTCEVEGKACTCPIPMSLLKSLGGVNTHQYCQRKRGR